MSNLRIGAHTTCTQLSHSVGGEGCLPRGLSARGMSAGGYLPRGQTLPCEQNHTQVEFRISR